MASNKINRSAVASLMNSDIVDRGVKHFAEELLTESDLIVPYDTGDLFRSGKVEAGPRTASYNVVYGNAVVTYAVHVYFGHKTRKTVGRTFGSDRVQARPWIMNAALGMARRNS